MNCYRWGWVWVCLLFPVMALAEQPLYSVLLNPNDKPSLQRGAKIYINYCLGCHSLHYLRYQRLAHDLAIVDEQGRVLNQLISEKLILNNDKITDIIQTAMPAISAQRWFGVVPPDLSLIARAKGADWLYTYLKTFYRDTNHLWGSNNLLSPQVAMPNVLGHLQGTQIPVYKSANLSSAELTDLMIDHLVLIEQGQLNAREFNQLLTDLINFLVYVSEPTLYEREKIGRWLLFYLMILVVILFYLRKNDA